MKNVKKQNSIKSCIKCISNICILIVFSSISALLNRHPTKTLLRCNFDRGLYTDGCESFAYEIRDSKFNWNIGNGTTSPADKTNVNHRNTGPNGDHTEGQDGKGTHFVLYEFFCK